MRGRLLHTINSLALSVTCGDGEGEPAKEKASAARIRRFSESSNECADAFYFVCDCVVQ